jgi:hypothetical protein
MRLLESGRIRTMPGLCLYQVGKLQSLSGGSRVCSFFSSQWRRDSKDRDTKRVGFFLFFLNIKHNWYVLVVFSGGSFPPPPDDFLPESDRTYGLEFLRGRSLCRINHDSTMRFFFLINMLHRITKDLPIDLELQ